MPIGLLKLPSVIREEVFRNSKCSHLFQLSLCSLRIRKYIERVKFTIPKLRYEATEDRFLVGILRDVCHIETIATIDKVICTDQQIKELALLKDVKIGYGYYMPTKFHLRIGTNKIPHIFMAVAKINGRMQSELQKHVTSLFGYCGSNKLKMDIEELSDNLPNVVNVKDSDLEGWKVEINVIENFFKRFLNHRSAHIKAIVNGELREDSGVFDIPHFSLRNQSSYYFQRFRGRNLVFNKAKLDTSDIIDFLNNAVGSNKLKMDIEELSNNLPNVVNVKDSVLEGWKVEMNVIDGYFKQHPNHRSALIEATINGELNEKSALFDIPHIGLGNQSTYYFQRFRGRNLYFHRAEMDTSDITDFLNKMPIGLLKLPSVIRDEVFRNLKCSHLFQLSLCSLRIKKNIEGVKFTIPKLRYEATEDEFLVGILRDVCHIETIAIIEKESSTDQKMDGLEKIRIGDDYYMSTRFHLLIGTNKIPHIVMKVKEINGRMQSELQKHVTSLFGYCGSNKLKMDIEELSDNLPNIINVKDSILEGSKVEMNVIDEFFKQHPNHRSVHIKATINGKLPEDSTLFDISNISFGNQSSYYFQRFRGCNLVFHKAEMDTSDIIDFLNKWVNNIAYHDLKTLIVRFKWGYSISKGSVLEAFETKQYDSLNTSDRPESFLWDPKIIGYYPRHISLRDASFFEVKRKIDGRKGYLNFENDAFRLFMAGITE